MKRFRAAVIGGGHLGRIHARLLKANSMAQLVAVCDPQPRAQQSAIKDFDVRAVSDYRKIIDDIDIAIIATPSHQHAEIARCLIEQGKHLLIEKPMTVSAKDAREIADLAADKNICIQVGHVERFNPAIQAALKEIGTPKFVEATRLSGFTYRSVDIGVVHDLMIHDIDLVNQMFDGDLVHSASSGIAVLGQHEDIAHTRLQFACGGVANLTASRCSYTNERTFRVFGTKGFANVDLAKHLVTVVRIPSWVQSRQVDFLNLSEEQKCFVRENLFSEVLEKTDLNITPINAIEAEQTDWLKAIREQRDPLVTADEGARNVEIAERIIQQIEAHAWSPQKKSMVGSMAFAEMTRHTSDPLPTMLTSGRISKAA